MRSANFMATDRVVSLDNGAPSEGHELNISGCAGLPNTTRIATQSRGNNSKVLFKAIVARGSYKGEGVFTASDSVIGGLIVLELHHVDRGK